MATARRGLADGSVGGGVGGAPRRLLTHNNTTNRKIILMYSIFISLPTYFYLFFLSCASIFLSSPHHPAPPRHAPPGPPMLPALRLKLPPPGDHKTPRKFEMLPRYFNFFIPGIRHEEFPFLSSPRKYKLGELIIISPDFTRTGHFVEEQRQGAWVPIAMGVLGSCGWLCSVCEVL